MKKDVCGIYYIKNLLNGRLYIGQSVSVLREFVNYHKPALRHNRHYNRHLQNAWNKYGEENFEHGIICECSERELNNLEIFYIKELSAHRDLGGYNISWGGDAPMRGRKHSDETKKNMSESRRGKNNGMFGRSHTEDSRKKIKENHADFSNGKSPLIGKPFSDSHRKNISDSLKGLFAGEKHPRFGKKTPGRSSIYYGVTKKGNYWMAQIWVDGSRIYLGQSRIEEKVARAYDAYVVENHLSHPLNFPDEWEGA